MIEILLRLLGRLNDMTLCSVLTRALEDCTETNHTIETIRKAWIPKCDFYSAVEGLSYMRSEGEEDLRLTTSEFVQTFYILEGIGTMDKYQPPLQMDEFFLEYASTRYAVLKEVVFLSGENVVPREIETECWLLQINFGSLLIDAVASVARENMIDLTGVTRAIYQEIKRSMLPIDTFDLDHYFVSETATSPHEQESPSRKGKATAKRTPNLAAIEDPVEIAYGVWTVGRISPDLDRYVKSALERNGDAMKFYYDSSALYSFIMKTKQQPAGIVFEENQTEIMSLIGKMANFWGLAKAAAKAEELWEVWRTERLRGCDRLNAFNRTIPWHVAYYSALAEERFIDTFVRRTLRFP